MIYRNTCKLTMLACALAVLGTAAGCSEQRDDDDGQQGHVWQQQTDALRDAQQLGDQIEEQEKRKQQALEETRQ
ncbi:MAG: hypothetical protein JSW10_07735 [Pseudomonadota bacterium]|nr:MAG: hypothetical protein JSW10_07735 [Pseudomonadota bacterium]